MVVLLGGAHRRRKIPLSGDESPGPSNHGVPRPRRPCAHLRAARAARSDPSRSSGANRSLLPNTIDPMNGLTQRVLARVLILATFSSPLLAWQMTEDLAFNELSIDSAVRPDRDEFIELRGNPGRYPYRTDAAGNPTGAGYAIVVVDTNTGI